MASLNTTKAGHLRMDCPKWILMQGLNTGLKCVTSKEKEIIPGHSRITDLDQATTLCHCVEYSVSMNSVLRQNISATLAKPFLPVHS